MCLEPQTWGDFATTTPTLMGSAARAAVDSAVPKTQAATSDLSPLVISVIGLARRRH